MVIEFEIEQLSTLHIKESNGLLKTNFISNIKNKTGYTVQHNKGLLSAD